ncbi:hypothetical protein MLD38_007227 [Melastoma candidum]|uniref:Uncharacterized protein n=1 Tax=Melastoma candidum TaxID=119954 RepID=A0ACB9RQF4_9MYRT|nr:hypothetical protein MLD38_007227 [Melastoma candidum]
MPINRESVPPPTIGKIGPYTVFMTPPSTPKPSLDTNTEVVLPPVQPPPQQLVKVPGGDAPEDRPLLGFFKNALHKFHDAHSSLDDHMARWLGLNQSKYQWALDNYYETKGLEKESVKAKECSNKQQQV